MNSNFVSEIRWKEIEDITLKVDENYSITIDIEILKTKLYIIRDRNKLLYKSIIDSDIFIVFISYRFKIIDQVIRHILNNARNIIDIINTPELINLFDLLDLHDLKNKIPNFEKYVISRESSWTIEFYNFCKKYIKDRDFYIDFIKYLSNESLRDTFLFDNEDVYNQIYIHNEIELSSNSSIDYFKWNGKNTSYPNIIIDLNEELAHGVDLLKQYKEILKNVNDIKFNKIYRIKLENRTFIIQILYSVNEYYYVFIFECFQNVDKYLELFGDIIQNKSNENKIDFLRILNNEIYVLVCYRDITIIKIQKEKNPTLFVNETGLYKKILTYYGDYLMTSTAYYRNNMLSILFLLYGIILKEVEGIYDKNKQGVYYSDFIVLELLNATYIGHENCPYCQLGFRLAKKDSIEDCITENPKLLNNLNSNFKNKLITNKDILCLTNEYKQIRFNTINPSKLHSTKRHYFNPSHHQLDQYVLQKMMESNKDNLGINLVKKTDLVQRITEDLRQSKNRFLISKFDKFIDNATRQQLIRNHYKSNSENCINKNYKVSTSGEGKCITS
jgi:hypothetical protein